MVGPPKLDLMRSMARWGRRLDPAEVMRGQRSSFNSRFPTRTPKAAAKRARHHRLTRYARLTFEKLAPLWDGAISVFSPSVAKNGVSRATPPSGFRPERFGLPSHGTPLGNFAAMRARLPRGPSFNPSLRHGPGLQSARAFSSAPQGARLFETMITNAPLALRAVGCELDDQWSRKNSAQAWTAFAHSMKVHRYGAQYGQRMLTPVKASETLNSSPVKASSAELLEADDELSQQDLDYLFPLTVSKTSRHDVVTTLYVPLEPDIEAWRVVEDFVSLEASGNMLDHAIRDKLYSIHAAYSLHEKRLTALELLLREYGIWPNSLDVAELLRSSRSGQPLALQVEFNGWRKDDVASLLTRRLGSFDWCTLFEEDYTSLSFGPPDEANSELDVLDPIVLESFNSRIQPSH